MVYGVQREDCGSFAIAADIAPTHGAAFRDALARGAEVLCYACKVSLEGIELDRPLAVEPLFPGHRRAAGKARLRAKAFGGEPGLRRVDWMKP